MSTRPSSNSTRPSTPSGVSLSAEGTFGEGAVEKREKELKEEAYGSLKAKQDAWRQATKTVKDLEALKGRSSDEEQRLADAKRYLLLNEKPAGAGRKTRRGGKKHAKKGRKGGKSRRH